MPIVTIVPSEIKIDVNEGEPVAEAAWRQGLVWPTKCWGQLDCMSCFTKILDGELSAKPADDEEVHAMRLRMAPRMLSTLVRLGCRLIVLKPGLVLEKHGVRSTDADDSNMTDLSEQKVED
jgi:2Fe-2S ferredoxin